MDLEQQLRAALAPRSSGGRVRAAVLAHLSTAPSSPGPWRLTWFRTLIVSGIVCAAAAAAVLLQDSKSQVRRADLAEAPHTDVPAAYQPVEQPAAAEILRSTDDHDVPRVEEHEADTTVMSGAGELPTIFPPGYVPPPPGPDAGNGTLADTAARRSFDHAAAVIIVERLIPEAFRSENSTSGIPLVMLDAQGKVLDAWRLNTRGEARAISTETYAEILQRLPAYAGEDIIHSSQQLVNQYGDVATVSFAWIGLAPGSR